MSSVSGQWNPPTDRCCSLTDYFRNSLRQTQPIEWILMRVYTQPKLAVALLLLRESSCIPPHYGSCGKDTSSLSPPYKKPGDKEKESPQKIRRAQKSSFVLKIMKNSFHSEMIFFCRFNQINGQGCLGLFCPDLGFLPVRVPRGKGTTTHGVILARPGCSAWVCQPEYSRHRRTSLLPPGNSPSTSKEFPAPTMFHTRAGSTIWRSVTTRGHPRGSSQHFWGHHHTKTVICCVNCKTSLRFWDKLRVVRVPMQVPPSPCVEAVPLEHYGPVWVWALFTEASRAPGRGSVVPGTGRKNAFQCVHTLFRGFLCFSIFFDNNYLQKVLILYDPLLSTRSSSECIIPRFPTPCTKMVCEGIHRWRLDASVLLGDF